MHTYIYKDVYTLTNETELTLGVAVCVCVCICICMYMYMYVCIFMSKFVQWLLQFSSSSL